MAIKLVDPLEEKSTSEEAKQVLKGPTAAEVAGLKSFKKTSIKEGLIGPRPSETYRGERRNAEHNDPYGRDPALMADFRNFLTVVWEYLRLPVPSDVQLSLGWFVQNGPERSVILGFRGMAKSWITGAYALWRLYCDPQCKILIVSASLDRAVQTVQWCLALIRGMPELLFLEPDLRKNQRASGKQFDVGPALPDQSPSMRGAGINGQITGSRSHLIVADDVEIPSNSMTTLMREKISEAVKEFDAILHPGGEIKFLGTPQSDDSLYPKLSKRGYTIRIWPARFPDAKQSIKYGDRLSPWIADQVRRDPTIIGKSVWSGRFSDDDLASRELSYGRSGFALQFMLDTSLSDADRYPLKLRDLIVESLDYVQAPDVITWGNSTELAYKDLPAMGFDGDHYFQPAMRSSSFSKYNEIVAFIDPSGRGADETAMTIGAELHGRVFHLCTLAWRDGYDPETLRGIAKALVQYRVNRANIEDNFGDGMFLALLQPHVTNAWKKHNAARPAAQHGGTSLEGVRSARVQKELRILAILEPATQQHRVVVNKAAIEADFKSVQAMQEVDGTDTAEKYSLFHQMTHLSRERDCLLHDDRVESLAGMVEMFAEIIGINPFESAKERDEERLEEELEKLFEDADEIGQYSNTKDKKSWQLRTKNAVRPN